MIVSAASNTTFTLNQNNKKFRISSSIRTDVRIALQTTAFAIGTEQIDISHRSQQTTTSLGSFPDCSGSKCSRSFIVTTHWIRNDYIYWIVWRIVSYLDGKKKPGKGSSGSIWTGMSVGDVTGTGVGGFFFEDFTVFLFGDRRCCRRCCCCCCGSLAAAATTPSPLNSTNKAIAKTATTLLSWKFIIIVSFVVVGFKLFETNENQTSCFSFMTRKEEKKSPIRIIVHVVFIKLILSYYFRMN